MELGEFLSPHTISVVVLVWLIDKIWRIEFAALYRNYGASYIPDKMLFSAQPGITDLFWGVMYGLIVFFVEIPFKAGLLVTEQVFGRGFLIGMAIYMLFNLMNKDVMYHWSMLLILIDVAWGGFLVGIFTIILLA